MAVERLAADGGLPLPGPRLTVPPVAVTTPTRRSSARCFGPLPESVADGGDRVGPGGEGLAVEREAVGRQLGSRRLPVTVAE